MHLVHTARANRAPIIQVVAVWQFTFPRFSQGTYSTVGTVPGLVPAPAGISIPRFLRMIAAYYTDNLI